MIRDKLGNWINIGDSLKKETGANAKDDWYVSMIVSHNQIITLRNKNNSQIIRTNCKEFLRSYWIKA